MSKVDAKYYDIQKVIEVTSADECNKLLSEEDWVLLDTISYTYQANQHDQAANTKYILGQLGKLIRGVIKRN